jgi:ribosomal protein S18 acetylase RimI-like enzyme
MASTAQPAQLPMCLVPVTGDGMLAEITALEAASYPADEAASPENIAYRVRNAAPYFRVAVGSSGDGNDTTAEVLGFVNGTLSHEPSLTHESMSVHEADGSSLCVHSVVTHPKHRRKGVASAMLRAYLAGLPAQVQRVLLLTKEALIPLYRQCGFELVGVSQVVHGQTPWFEMRHSRAAASEGANSSSSSSSGSSTAAPAAATGSGVQSAQAEAEGASRSGGGGGGSGDGGGAAGVAGTRGAASSAKREEGEEAAAIAASGGPSERRFDVATADAHKLPALAVFDLDACFWDEEMCVPLAR